jgi:hypothetical protein
VPGFLFNRKSGLPVGDVAVPYKHLILPIMVHSYPNGRFAAVATPTSCMPHNPRVITMQATHLAMLVTIKFTSFCRLHFSPNISEHRALAIVRRLYTHYYCVFLRGDLRLHGFKQQAPQIEVLHQQVSKMFLQVVPLYVAHKMTASSSSSKLTTRK